MTRDPYTILRALQDLASDDARRRSGRGLTAAYPTMVGQVFAERAVPSGGGVYVSVHPVDVLGVEREGGAGTLATDVSRVFRAYLAGSRPVAAGDYLICRFVGDRWVADPLGKTPTAGAVIPGCACTKTPLVVHLSMNRPDAAVPLIHPCTLQWGPTPAGLLPLSLGTECHLSTTTFPDPVTGDRFWYHLSCSLAYYQLTRVYAVSLYGSPYRDSLRYRWLIGAAGNSCAPFLMANGTIYPGGDPACVVTLSE